jgi:hypothetical protein
MDQTTAKSQAAGVGAGLGAAIAAAICQGIFGYWPFLVGPPWESIITGAVTALVGAALAAYAAWQVRNAMTAPQIVTAIDKGDLKAATVAKVADDAAPKPAKPAAKRRR